MPERNDRCIVAAASHSHLFPGALLQVASYASEEPAMEPLTIVFADGVESQGELMKAAGIADAADVALFVDGYTTAAGTAVPQKIWQIRGHSIEDGVLTLRIGRRLGP